MKRYSTTTQNRRGSTLLIVLALLSLLMFMGMVFYTFAAQERSAADYFSEAAKAETQVNDDPFPWGLQQLLTGAGSNQKGSVLWSPRARLSLVTGIMGYDAVPYNGHGNRVIYDSTPARLPVIDNDYDGSGDGFGVQALNNPLNFVDSLAAWGGGRYWPTPLTVDEDDLMAVRGPRATTPFPEPDVDYTYPDINNVLVAYRGWGIRDNGAGHTPASERYERVPVFIPTGMRPGLMKSGNTNSSTNQHVPTDYDWYDQSAHPEYSVRSLRPSQHHIAGFRSNGTPVRRYLDATNPADSILTSTHGPFPLRPNEDVNPTDFGRMGVFTGHDPGPAAGPINFRLDQDNDGDGIFEGIWMDLGYPIQETAAGVEYATMHSFTIYDLAGLIDLNSHGNITELNRTQTLLAQLSGGGGATDLSVASVSTSNQGLGPNEVNPIYALTRTDSPGSLPTNDFYGAAPANRLEEANMQWINLLAGWTDGDEIYDGRWGDANALMYHWSNGRNIAHLPRPGRSGNLVQTTTGVISFGGAKGYDDNGNAYEGVRSTVTGRRNGFVHPFDVGGTGRTTMLNDPRIPDLFQIAGTSPERWLRYSGYSLVGQPANPDNESKYLAGIDGAMSGGGTSDLYMNPRYNLAFEDPLETVMDLDQAVRPDDAYFAPADLAPGHLSANDRDKSITRLSDRLGNLAAEAFGSGSNISDRFTTISNSLRAIPHSHDLGADRRLGTGDDGPRAWEWSADSDNDNRMEFPPQFGSVAPYTPVDPAASTPGDPFRAVVRRLLTTEAGENRELSFGLPLSLNHILDVERTAETPPESSQEFLNYMRRTGIRFRPLTEHPLADEPDGSGGYFADTPSIPDYSSTQGQAILRQFPPRDPVAREFWARRDRQQLARDIYVLLYTLSGAQQSSTGTDIRDYTAPNDPSLDPSALPSNPAARFRHGQLRRMAQFAVNIVDAMDTDDISTKFEYDKNLSDGWDLDDDPYTGDPPPTQALETGEGLDPTTHGPDDPTRGLYPYDTPNRGVVFGVEAQQLSFSEVLAVRMADFARVDPNMPDDPTTMFPDASSPNPLTTPETERKDRYVLHLELQNNQPYPVPLSINDFPSTPPITTTTSDGDQAIWQLARIDRSAGSNAAQDVAPTQTMNFLDGNGVVAGGERFSISMATIANTASGDAVRSDPLGTGNAELYLQTPASGTGYALISPSVGPSPPTHTPGAPPKSDLDTIDSTHTARFTHGTNNAVKGTFLEGITYVAPFEYQGNDAFGFTSAAPDDDSSESTGQGFEVALRRRANPHLPHLRLTENPWIEVDRIKVEFKDLFTFDTSTATPTATPHLDFVKSQERREPLDATDVAQNALPTPGDYRYNTIASNDSAFPRDGANNVSNAQFNVWQPHFDRDFTSVVELFQLPLVGPKLLTQRLNRMRYAPAQQVSGDAFTPVDQTVTSPGDPSLASSAVAMFLQPDVLPAGNDANDNAWYRLLQFVEVPSRVNTMLGNYLTRHRVPGKVNLNGIRHIDVYAGLIDDPLVADVPLLETPGTGTANDVGNRFAPFMYASSNPFPISGAGPRATSGTTAIPNPVNNGFRDRWFEFQSERDGATSGVWNPVNSATTTFWIPGTPNARPFRSLGHRAPVLNQIPAPGTPTARDTVGSGSDTILDETVLRRYHADANDTAGTPDQTNRHWLELGASTDHQNPPNGVGLAGVSQRERHQVLQRVLNNSTTVSNSFIIYGTVGYFKAVEDATAPGLYRIGGRMGLDLDNNGTETDDAGWEQRAVFIVDRTELLNAYDEGTGNFDWQRLIKYRADLPSDGS